MPIKPENKGRYPKNWKQIRQKILDRAGNFCEFCGRENHTQYFNEKTGRWVKVVLTIAHLNHQPEDCDEENLKALCQRCHLLYDSEHHRKTAQQTRLAKDKSLTIEFNEQ